MIGSAWIQKHLFLDPPNPKQHHPTNDYSKQKACAKHIAGLAISFKEGHSLSNVHENVLNPFIKNGLDTITYLPDISDQTDMVNIMITDHPKFTTTLAELLKIAVSISAKYYSFDVDNSIALMSKTLLLQPSSSMHLLILKWHIT